jgi:hypothetical protein
VPFRVRWGKLQGRPLALSATADDRLAITGVAALNRRQVNRNRMSVMLRSSCCSSVERAFDQRAAARGGQTRRQTNRTAMSSMDVPYKGLLTGRKCLLSFLTHSLSGQTDSLKRSSCRRRPRSSTHRQIAEAFLHASFLRQGRYCQL